MADSDSPLDSPDFRLGPAHILTAPNLGGLGRTALGLRATSDDFALFGGGGDVSPRGENRVLIPRREDPDVLYYGDELRLYATSEYALAAAYAPQQQTGGYVGLYFKLRRRKSRTGQQPLVCLPPMGPGADGEFSESLFRCIDPNGHKTTNDPVKLDDELLLVDADGHVWNTSTPGVVEYLTMRLRGERGEMRVRFTRDLSSVPYLGRSRTTPEEDDASPVERQQSSPRAGMSRPKSHGRLRHSPKSMDNLQDAADRPNVRYGDSVWLVSCPAQHEKNHPGATRNMRREHVLTNYKRETSSLLGGYVTVDPKGFALHFIVSRAAPYIDSLVIGDSTWFSLPWGRPVCFELRGDNCSLVIDVSSGARATIDDLTAGDTFGNSKFWLGLEVPAGTDQASGGASADTASVGCVLVELSNCRHMAPQRQLSTDCLVPCVADFPISKIRCAATSLLVALVARCLLADSAARAIAVLPPVTCLAPRHEIREFLIAAAALLVASVSAKAGWTAWLVLLVVALKLADDDDQQALTQYNTTAAPPSRYRGTFTVWDWSPVAVSDATSCSSQEVSTALLRGSAALGNHEAGKVHAELIEMNEEAAIVELRQQCKAQAFSSRWLEDGELLRFVRARKTIQQSIELFKEAMDWRRTRCRSDDVYTNSWKRDPELGSFGCLERVWTSPSDSAVTTPPPPAWWNFLSSNIPFEVYGADASGLPITYLGLGRMDLSSVCREVGLERLEQKIVMQNDMFLDVAREARRASKCKALHGGVFIVDLDGMGRKAFKEIHIFKRVSAALKILHPERQRKTFLVRAPRFFHFVWKVIKPALDQRILSKIVPLEANNLKPLIDELGAENVPNVLGGTFQLKCPLDADRGCIEPGAFEQYCHSVQ